MKEKIPNNELIKRILERLIGAYSPQKIMLYGSYAGGGRIRIATWIF